MASGDGMTVPESVRSRAWAVAKPVALEEWSKGSSDTTQMLIACSRALDAVLALFEETDSMEVFVAPDGENGIRPTPGPPYRVKP